jgi:hypothetical protein
MGLYAGMEIAMELQWMTLPSTSEEPKFASPEIASSNSPGLGRARELLPPNRRTNRRVEIPPHSRRMTPTGQKTYRALLVGTGGIGDAHVRAVEASRGRVELVGAVDLTHFRRGGWPDEA